MDSTPDSLFSMPSLERLVEGNVLCVFPIMEQIEADADGDVDFTAGALVVHLGERLEPRLTWVGATELCVGMSARSEVFTSADAAFAKAVQLAGWSEVGV
jgi:hypothetical protein